MKKFTLCVITVILLLTPIHSLACQVPLKSQGRSVYIDFNNNVRLTTYKLNLTVRTGYTSATTSMTIENTSNQELNIRMGMPTTVRNLSVSVENKSYKVITRKGISPPNTETTDVPDKFFTWDVKLLPGEIKTVNSQFSIDNKRDTLGTEQINFPLNSLVNWYGKIDYVQIIADLDYKYAYVFSENSFTVPDEYDQGGRLTWRFYNIDSPKDFSLNFRPIESIINNYLTTKYPEDEVIKSILDTFDNYDFDNTIRLIDNYIKESSLDDKLNDQLTFIKALCHMKLFNIDMAENIYDDIEQKQPFEGPVSTNIRNKIIYDKYMIYTYQGNEDKAREFLISKKDATSDSQIFSIWLNNQIKKLTPEIVKEEIEDDPAQLEEEIPEAEDKVVKTVNIFGKEISVENLVLAAVVVLLLLIIIFSKSKKRRRKYMFR